MWALQDKKPDVPEGCPTFRWTAPRLRDLRDGAAGVGRPPAAGMCGDRRLWSGIVIARDLVRTVMGRSQRLKQKAHLRVSSRMVLPGSCALVPASAPPPDARPPA